MQHIIAHHICEILNKQKPYNHLNYYTITIDDLTIYKTSTIDDLTIYKTSTTDDLTIYKITDNELPSHRSQVTIYQPHKTTIEIKTNYKNRTFNTEKFNLSDPNCINQIENFILTNIYGIKFSL